MTGEIYSLALRVANEPSEEISTAIMPLVLCFHCLQDVKARPLYFNTLYFMEFHEAHIYKHNANPTTLHSFEIRTCDMYSQTCNLLTGKIHLFALFCCQFEPPILLIVLN